MKRILTGICLFLVLGCTDRSHSPTTPGALEIGTSKTIFAATNRSRLEDGSFGPQRSEDYSLLELTVSIPPNHSPGTLEFGYAKPDPNTQFTMAARHEFEKLSDFDQRLQKELHRFAPNERDVIVFVHGFNSTQAETVFRAAQLTHDLETPGATVIYSWPSLGSPLGYAYDADSVLFARDGLEKLLRHLKKAGANRIVLVAHSMGSLLAMEALRQIEIKSPNWSDQNLGGVILMSPDLDIDVFRSQMSRFEKVPQPFLVLVSRKDTILNISRRIRGTHSRERLGSLSSLDLVEDLPIDIIDTTEFSENAESGHFVAATSPALLSLFNSARQTADAFQKGNAKLSVNDFLPGTILRKGQVTEVSMTLVTNDPR